MSNRNVRLYPQVIVTGQSFVGVKRVTVPKQSLSLRDIVSRFVRREPLPISREGLYEDRFGDLEKISKADITEQMDRVAELKRLIADFNKREKARIAKKAADDEAARVQSIKDEAVKLSMAKSARVQGAASDPASGGV